MSPTTLPVLPGQPVLGAALEGPRELPLKSRLLVAQPSDDSVELVTVEDGRPTRRLRVPGPRRSARAEVVGSLRRGEAD